MISGIKTILFSFLVIVCISSMSFAEESNDITGNEIAISQENQDLELLSIEEDEFTLPSTAVDDLIRDEFYTEPTYIEPPSSLIPSLLKTSPPRKKPKFVDIKEITNAIDKDYSFLYDPSMKPQLISDIIDNPQNYVVMYLETGDAVLIQLKITTAPNTSKRFKELVQKSYYNDMEIFRAIPNYLVQMGDPSGSGYGGLGVFYFAEINKQEKFKRGTVAMSNNGNLQSDDTQFFITFNDFQWLDGKYTIFGEVVYGLEKLEDVGGSFMNQGFIDHPVIVTKVELLSDRPIDRKDSLNSIIPVDMQKRAQERQKASVSKNQGIANYVIEQEQIDQLKEDAKNIESDQNITTNEENTTNIPSEQSPPNNQEETTSSVNSNNEPKEFLSIEEEENFKKEESEKKVNPYLSSSRRNRR